MATVLATPAAPAPPPPVQDPGPGSVWHAPLVPVALAATVGIVLDRLWPVPLVFSLIAVAVALVAWVITRTSRRPGLPLAYLGLAVAALAAARHHVYHDVYPADDIGRFAPAEPQPAQLRGVLEEEPVVSWRPAKTPLDSVPPRTPLEAMKHPGTADAVLEVTHLRQHDAWLPVSGRARLAVAGGLPDMHAGDEIEVVGWLAQPAGPDNPGEFDHAAHLRDRRINAVVVVHKTPDAVTRLAESWPYTLTGWLAVVRGRGQRALQEYLPGDSVDGVGMALLLGEGATMTTEDWDRYVRTGVIHALAISGQHLAVLGWFVWGLLRLFGVRRRRGAWVVCLLLVGYALLTGGQPPILRSAVMVCVLCGGLILRRPAQPANAFALAWLVLAVLSPADLFRTGCQLSFLAVAVLFWSGADRWLRRSDDPLDRLVEQTRPLWQRLLFGAGRWVGTMYLLSAAIWLAVTPLAAARYHLVAPAALLIGPPVVLLTSIALITGFLLLVASAVCWPLAPLFAWPTYWSLSACEWLVDLGDALPLGHWYVSDVPEWWLAGFYLGLLAVLLVDWLRRRWLWATLAGLGWLCVLLLGGLVRPTGDELRITFVAVGHGGCTVLETPDGRVLLYDAGAITGPDVTRRHIAPFLWSRGVRRIDEVFLSHADLDHFNGLPPLLERFAVGQVTCTPTFAEKTTGGVQLTLEALHQHGIPVRIVKAGDRLTASEVEMEVLHPPAAGPEGNENARSLVLLVRHAGHTVLLTGDLEGPGLERVLALPPPRVDVLMAPHHGSRAANRPDVAAWARPRVVVACQGPPQWPARGPDPYSGAGAHFLGTWPNGAVTVHSHRTGLVVETFRTSERFVVRVEGDN